MNKKKRMNSWMIFQIGWRGIKLQLFCNSLKKLTGFLSLFFRVSEHIIRGLRNFLSFKSDASSSLADRITSLDATCYTLLGRDAPDVPAALRSIAIGFTGDTLGSGRKSSRTSIDEVEKWWLANGKGKSAYPFSHRAIEVEMVKDCLLCYIFKTHKQCRHLCYQKLLIYLRKILLAEQYTEPRLTDLAAFTPGFQ